MVKKNSFESDVADVVAVEWWWRCAVPLVMPYWTWPEALVSCGRPRAA